MLIPSKIVVPTDFSATAAKALAFALALAEKSGASVMQYHVVIPVESSFVGNETERAEFNADLKRQAMDQMNRIVKEVASPDSTVSVSNTVGEAPLIASVLNFASSEGADCIVMGTLGATGLREAIIGSTATRILQNATMPVWLIPDEESPEPVQQMLMAASYLPATLNWLPQVADFADLLNKGLTLVHIVNTDNYSYNAKSEKQAFDRFRADCESRVPGRSVQFRLLESTSVMQAMEELDEKFSFDILVMVRQQKDFWEKFMEKSMTRHMACFTKRALLVLNEPEME